MIERWNERKKHSFLYMRLAMTCKQRDQRGRNGAWVSVWRIPHVVSMVNCLSAIFTGHFHFFFFIFFWFWLYLLCLCSRFPVFTGTLFQWQHFMYTLLLMTKHRCKRPQPLRPNEYRKHDSSSFKNIHIHRFSIHFTNRL